MAKQHAIFIGYRRGDTADAAGRIYDRLEAKFGKVHVFKDVDSIPFGEDFGAYVSGVIKQCKVFLPLIGPKWLDIRHQNGGRRIDDPADLVRIEIETALSTPGVRVVPVLLGGASMPAVEDLPPSLRRLASLNAAHVRPDPDFRFDIERLTRDLLPILRSPRSLANEAAQTTGRVWPFAAVGVGALAIAALAIVLLKPFDHQPTTLETPPAAVAIEEAAAIAPTPLPAAPVESVAEVERPRPAIVARREPRSPPPETEQSSDDTQTGDPSPTLLFGGMGDFAGRLGGSAEETEPNR